MQGKVLVSAFVGLGLAAVSALAPGKEITLPPDVSKLRPSALPGFVLAQQKCGICHSADYINYQPPGMNRLQWTAEVEKMRHSYGAPLDEHDVESIGAYLAVAYGSARAGDPDVIAASAAPETTMQGTRTKATIDVPTLLRANACLGCHAIDRKVVGPAFRAVAEKYRGKAHAEATVAASIRNGGIGKWGNVPMPPMSSLTEAQARALAAYVLRQNGSGRKRAVKH